MKDSLFKTATWILAVSMVVFGSNKFLGFIPVEPPADPDAQAFLGTMFSSYLYVVVGMAEILGGILLVIPRTRLLGWFLLLPVIFNIALFHLAHDFIGNGIWLLPLALFVITGYYFKKQVGQILNTAS